MEGYYWRITDAATGRVVVVLCGVVARAGRPRVATVALAAHGEGLVRSVAVTGVAVAPDAMRIDVGVLRATEDRLRVDLGPGARLDVAVERPRRWSRPVLGGLGPAHLVPGLSQYWHPHLLGSRVTGTAELGGARLPLGGATAYAEKNWGAGFPSRWWWGQAQGFAEDACVAFAGGRLEAGPLALSATSLVIRVDARLLRLVAPAALVTATAGDGAWRVRARSPRFSAEVEGEAGPSAPAELPLPAEAPGPVPGAVRQHLAGRMRVVLRAGRRTLWRGESRLAGLEDGRLPRG